MKRLVILPLFLVSFVSSADSVRSGNLSCTSNSDSPFSIELNAGNDKYRNEYGLNLNQSNDTSVGIKFKYEFGGSKPLDCSKLYDLIIREKQAQVAELEAKLKLLEKANKADW